MYNVDIVQNLLDFGFYRENESLLFWRDFCVDISNSILVTKDRIYRCKDNYDLWNKFITIYG